MTLPEIIAAAEAYIDDEIEIADALVALNEAQDKLGDMALVYDQDFITAPAPNAWCDLPADLTTLVEVQTATGDRYRGGYRKRGQMVCFEDAGTYKVIYRRMPAAITEDTTVPEIHSVFHPALVTYLRSWVKLKEDEDSEDGLRLRQDFYTDAERAYRTMARSERRPVTYRVDRAVVRG